MEDEWTVNANNALSLSLVRPTATAIDKVASFHPEFTYAVFGQDESIFGYKGLRIELQYDARDLRPNLSVSSARKFTAVGDVEAVDIRETLREFLPGVAFQSKQDFQLAIKNIPDNWTPPGSLLKTYEKNGETYEIWHGKLSDPAILQLVKRIQFVVLLFIEGGSYIGVDAEGKDEPAYSLSRWSIFFVYKKEADPAAAGKHQYTFQGYSTVYNFWMYQTPAPRKIPNNESWELPTGDFPLEYLPHRVRISQFVILPPFQGKGIGAFLYNTIFELAINNSAVKEVTVEDPNDDFDLLRDLCDMKYLRKNAPEFSGLRLNTEIAIPEKGATLHHSTQVSASEDASASGDPIVDIARLESLRVKSKIAPRQFSRLVEMHLMSTLPDSVRPQAERDSGKQAAPEADKHAYALWRLLLKQRLYRRNMSVLGEFEITERIIKLNETVGNVEWEYARILDRLESATTASDGKRKLDVADAGENPVSKKARVGDAS
ncbi:acyl-CoA N-acyltransferase [Durotheca rogersii]|uniref:acyl-CoA N-acyltransferase n=1 Tax=Durotheca rogersii TaxID=419775 RepID=UPI00221E4187|nr:acyl-CoA N-acyltransferase [Durotheca rogersii]KAI5862318.1 acyl-CoA N-acyltransferase [Durotheca rogersii]